MTSPLLNIPNLTTGAELERLQRKRACASWTVAEFAGRVVELRAVGPSPLLGFAARLILDAQQSCEPVVWISARDGLFYPPDFLDNGVDLEALAIVRLQTPKDAAIAADKLLRCGAFGLLILDLGDDPWFADALMNRLVRHAEQSQTAVVCLTEARRDMRVLGSLVSVRAEVTRTRTHQRFRCVARAERDRLRGPGWTFEEECDGTVGLR